MKNRKIPKYQQKKPKEISLHRKIKFRGWTNEGRMVIGDLLHSEDRVFIRYMGYSGEYTQFPVEPSTIGQYTGVKDKFGTEIYEGDYVLDKGRVARVIYWQYSFRMKSRNPQCKDQIYFTAMLHDYCKQEVEVIGNWNDTELRDKDPDFIVKKEYIPNF